MIQMPKVKPKMYAIKEKKISKLMNPFNNLNSPNKVKGIE